VSRVYVLGVAIVGWFAASALPILAKSCLLFGNSHPATTYNGREFAQEKRGMLAELDIVIFLKSDHDAERTAERVFGALGSGCRTTTSDTGDTYYEASGLGFRAELTDYDPYVEYQSLSSFNYELDIFSLFWCVDLDAISLEESLSEYFARHLAFELNMETASEVVLDTTEEVERLRVRVFRRNPQYRLDQAPTTPKVYIVEEHEREVPFDQDEYGEADGEDEDDAEEDLSVEEGQSPL